MNDTQRLIDDSDLRKYRHELPNMVDDLGLTPYAYRLYGHIKRRAGATAGGECFEGARKMAAHCNMSLGMVVKAKQELERAGLIKIKPGNPTTSTPDTITIVNIWLDNLRRYQTCSSGEQPVHVVNTPVHEEPEPRSEDEHPCSPGERKNKPPEERTERKNTHTSRGRARDKSADAGVCVSRFSLEERKAHAAQNGLGGGWLTNSADGRYDEIIGDQLPANGNANGKAPPQLSPEEADSLISQAAAMLRDGTDISDVDKHFAPCCPRVQWAAIRSAAQAQARVKPKPAESPPAPPDNVVPLARAHR